MLVAGTALALGGLASTLVGRRRHSGRQTGTTLGVAIAGTIVGSAHGAAFTSAARGVWWLVFGLGAGIVALGLVRAKRNV